MKSRVKIYKGELRCQFSTHKLNDLGAGSFKYAKLKLEPRFRLFKTSFHKEIEIINSELSNLESYFDFQEQQISCIQNGNFEIELYDKNEPRNGRRILAQQIYFSININETIIENEFVKGKVEWPTFEKNDKHDNKFHQTFISTLDKIKAGKIVGEAYVFEIEQSKENIDLVKIEPILPEPMVKKVPNGCLSLFFPSVPSRNNCLNKFLFLRSPSTDLNQNTGCLPLFFPGGNWGFNLLRRVFPSFGLPSAGVPGCGSLGCGCLSLLLLFLLPLLLFKMCNSNSDSATEQPVKIIHDTIIKEVIKEKVDTLFITKTDTVSLIDSTTVTTVEMVKLPNVQFYTDADVLLPSSAKELQKLAQYLTDNPDLKATIIGHTDNKGDPFKNLELSKRRAESVKNFLAQLGVKKDRLNSMGMGDKNPIGDNNKEEGRLMNRRVEVRLTEIGKIETKRSINQ